MKKLLLAVLIVSLGVGSAQASLRDFESETTTTATDPAGSGVWDADDWRNAGPTDWYFGADRDCTIPGESLRGVFIREEAPGGNKYLEVLGGDCWALVAVADFLDIVANPQQTLKYDFLMDGRTVTALYNGTFPFNPDTNYWSQNGNLYVDHETGELEIGGVATGEILTVGNWYTIESEWDFMMETVRGRIGPRGGAFGDWSTPGNLSSSAQPTGILLESENAANGWDNISLEPTGGGAGLLGDANQDGVVSADDYASVQSKFGDTGAAGILGDANQDGVVSADDYASVQSHFGDTAGIGSVPVPEPTTIGLLGMGLVAILSKRK